MPLSVTCPRCENKYQLDAAMRGKRMRCLNPICRAVIDVRDDSEPRAPVEPKPADAAPPIEAKTLEFPKPVPRPIEPAPTADFPDSFPGDDETASTLPPAPPSPPVAKPAAPKPVERSTPAPVKRTPVEPKPATDFPDDFPGDGEEAPAPTGPAIATEAWQLETPDAPPVREEPITPPMPTPASAPMVAATPAPVKRRRTLWLILAMVTLLGALTGGGYWRIRGGMATNEAERHQKAETLYQDKEYAEASSAWQKLQRDFPDSANAKKYRFLSELADVRQAVYLRESPQETSKALGRVLYLTANYADDPLLKERATELWQTFDFLAKELSAGAKEEKSSELLQSARRALAEAKKYSAPAGASQAESERTLNADWKDIEQILADHNERQHVIAALKKHLEKTNASAIQEAWAVAEKTKRQDEPGIRGLLDELVKAHREQIKFVPADGSTAAPPEDALVNLRMTPLVHGGVVATASKDPVLALARGVLYALEPAKGEVLWVRRLGVDTHVLPLRVPADAITPELLLTVSSDQRTMSALIAATGDVVWQTPLSDACVGQPVLVDRHVLAPTLAGRIDEIEIAEGRLIGAYQIGQPLTLGGVHVTGTSTVIFPADEYCLYVLDIAKRRCTNILYTRHPAGSLRGLPVVVPGEKGGWLLWSQATASGRVEIKPYQLPIQHPEQKPIEPIDLPGLSASPWPQADRLAVTTETGLLSLWGYKQKGTRDDRLFRLLKNDFMIADGQGPARSQIVHADAQTYWALTRSNLRCIETTFKTKDGPGLLTRWTQASPLGAPLHAAETRQGPDGHTILYLTTQADDHPKCLCSAVNAEDGKIIWQRQLGVLPQQPPREVAGKIVIRDANGLMRFDPAKLGNTDSPWQPAGVWLDQQPWRDGFSFMLMHGASFAQLSGPRGGKTLQVRHGAIAGDDKPRTVEIALADSLQGTPALAGDFLLLPLANGIIVRASLADGELTNGPDWRAVGAEDQARGHLVMLGPAEFVRTDGSRGLARISIADGKTWKPLAESAKLPHRIVKAPVVLLAAEGKKIRLIVADAADVVTLLDADRLTATRTWSMPGRITAGPFVRAGKIGCVVGRNRLVWIDPDRDSDKSLWEYGFEADIVGAPHLIDGLLVIADVAGQFVALNPTDGVRLGAGFTLRANVAASAAPLPFGPGQAFVPLTDGTAVLLPVAKLRTAK